MYNEMANKETDIFKRWVWIAWKKSTQLYENNWIWCLALQGHTVNINDKTKIFCLSTSY